jgi:hypothetical protein
MTKHTCFEQMNKKLEPFNTKLATGFGVAKDLSQISLVYFVRTEKVDASVRSKKAPDVIMSHCPFCGIKLSEVQS